MKHLGRRTTSAVDHAPPTPHRPLRGGPIPVSEDDLPFYAALVGRKLTTEDRTAVFLAEFAAASQQATTWRRVAERVKHLIHFKRAG